MRDIRVLESPYHVQEGIALGQDIAQRPAEPTLPANADAQSGDVIVLDLGVGRLARLKDRAQTIDACVGHTHGCRMGFDLPRAVRGRRDLALGQGVKDRGLGAIG